MNDTLQVLRLLLEQIISTHVPINTTQRYACTSRATQAGSQYMVSSVVLTGHK